MAYERMAFVYDHLMDEAPYSEWVHFTEEQIAKSGQESVKKIADLGCGTGEITLRLASEGYDLIGIDYSKPMLDFASEKEKAYQTSVEWLHQDIRALEGLENLDAVVSYCDVINYLTTPQEVETVFHHVAAMLRPGGMFLFDVHHLPFIMNYYMNETFADVTDEVSYIWFCEPEEEYGTMVHHLTFFYLTNGIYKRFDEKHVQRVFSINFYKEILNQAGFQNIKVFADFTTKEENIDDDAARIFFSAQKESR